MHVWVIFRKDAFFVRSRSQIVIYNADDAMDV